MKNYNFNFLLKSHNYYIVNPSLCSFTTGIMMFTAVPSLVYYINGKVNFLILDLFFMLLILFSFWIVQMILESTDDSVHTPEVQNNYTVGIILFILSEIMIFFGLFWTFFYSSINPNCFIGGVWPPIGILPLNPVLWPFFNTCILLLSGVSANIFYYTVKSLYPFIKFLLLNNSFSNIWNYYWSLTSQQKNNMSLVESPEETRYTVNNMVQLTEFNANFFNFTQNNLYKNLFLVKKPVWTLNTKLLKFNITTDLNNKLALEIIPFISIFGTHLLIKWNLTTVKKLLNIFNFINKDGINSKNYAISEGLKNVLLSIKVNKIKRKSFLNSVFSNFKNFSLKEVNYSEYFYYFNPNTERKIIFSNHFFFKGLFILDISNLWKVNNSNLAKIQRLLINKNKVIWNILILNRLLEKKFLIVFEYLAMTILLGVFFLKLQVYEYFHASFDITDSIYGSIFYSLTGIHGLHVLAGVVLLIINFIRFFFIPIKNARMNTTLFYSHVGLSASIWYWHFVDIVWVFVYLFIYIWSTLGFKL